MHLERKCCWAFGERKSVLKPTLWSFESQEVTGTLSHRRRCQLNGRELRDYTIYVIDVAGGDKVPRKGGPGITQSDLFVINKIDLAEAVGADLDVMARDSREMRGDGPTIFAAVKKHEGVNEILGCVLSAWRLATGTRA